MFLSISVQRSMNFKLTIILKLTSDFVFFALLVDREFHSKRQVVVYGFVD